MSTVASSPASLTGSLSVDLSAFEAAIDRLQQSATDGFSNPLIQAAGTEIANAYSGEVREHFMQQSHGGSEWAELADSTKYERARKAAGGFSPRMKGRMAAIRSIPFPKLYINGEIYTSFVPGERWNVLEFQPDRMRYGSSLPRAAYNHFGTIRIPARPILIPPSEQTLERARALLANAMLQIIHQSN